MSIPRYRARMQRLRALEPRHAALLRTALIRQAEAVAARLEQLPAVPDAAAAALLAALVAPDWLVAPLAALYVAAGVPEARLEYQHLTGGPGKAAPTPGLVAGWTSRLSRFITTEGALALRGITDTTRRVVRQVLGEAARQGSSIPQAARALRERIAALAPRRARLIARTELIAAANQGSLMGAEATGLALRKQWLATPSARTRPTHRNADGQAVGMREFFSVGGSAARYPGDPLLPANERCNCRCSIVYIPTP